MNALAPTPADPADAALLHEISELTKRDPLVGAKIGSNQLTQHLLTAMKSKRGVHLESLLCALGAIAGYACQASVRAQAIARGLPEAALLTSVQADDGKTYYFGDQLDQALAESTYSVWAVAGAATPQANATDLAEIFKHTSSAVGTAAFGRPRVPETNTALDLPLNYVRLFWPQLKSLVVKFCPNPEHWPVLIALSIQEAIITGQHVLAPGLALQLVMEAAIPMSRIELTVPALERSARMRRLRKAHAQTTANLLSPESSRDAPDDRRRRSR